MRNILVYDCEIKRAIPNKNEEWIPGVDYCNGWTDYEGMGIAVIGAYDYIQDRYRVFTDDNLKEFQRLIAAGDLVVGYNTLGFDNKLIAAHNLEVADYQNYDLLAELRKATGSRAAGLKLDAITEATFGVGKSDSGALAPIKWQRGDIGAVIDYCLSDVWLTKRLFDKVLAGEPIIDPRDGRAVTLPRTWE